ncbi:MAG: PAS domain S-box protein [Chloroflexota bacterium]
MFRPSAATERSFYRILAQNVPQSALLLFDSDLRILLVEGTVLARMGFSKAMLQGKRLSEIFPTETLAVVEPLYRAALAGEEHAAEQTINGEQYRAQYVPVKDQHGVITAGMVMLQNVSEQKLADAALHASEERYRLMAQNSTDLIAVQSPEGMFVDASPAARALLGYEPEDLIGHSLFEFVHADDIERVRRVNERVKQASNVMTIAYRIRCADGSYTWLESASHLINSPTAGAQIISASRDVSERMGANEALRRSEEQFRSLVASMDNLVFSIDLNGFFLVYHPMPSSIYETPFDSEIFVGKHYRDVLPPVFSTKLDEAVSIVISNLNTQEINYILEYSGEEHVYTARISPMIGTNLQLLGATVVVSDVTDTVMAHRRERRLLALEKIQHEISTLFLESDDPNLVIDQVLAALGTFFNVSRTYMFRLRENERLLDNTHEWCGPGVSAEMNNLQGIAYDEIFPSLLPLLVSDGIIASDDISKLPADLHRVYDAMGLKSILILPIYVDQRLEGFAAFHEMRHTRQWLPEEIASIRAFAQSCSRMFERQRSQLALIEARDTALLSARLKTDFVSNMSHEIRTPMTGVIGMLDLLRETNLSEDQKEFVEVAHTSAHRLLLLIGDILDFSKIEAGKVALEQIPLDVRGVVIEVESLLNLQATKKGLQLSATVADDVPARVLGDPTRLRQILTNLVANAIKFTERGTIQIGLQQLNSVYGRTRLRFEVSDTGIGIPADQQAMIFDSFVQADSSTTRRFGGAGLGLAICKQLVALMGGEIDVSSVIGTGSTFGFTVTLPIVALNDRATLNLDFNHLQVMVMDEENSARYLLAEQLRLWGTHVIEASSPAEANMLLVATARREEEVEILFFHSHQPREAQETFVANLRQTLAMQTPLLVQLYDHEVSASAAFEMRLRRPVHPADLHQLLANHDENGFAQAAPEIQESQIIPASVGGRVLVADDEPMNRQIVVHALEEFGYTVDIARNGEEVLAMIDKCDYQIILMDMHMPVMDGLEATRRIREQENGRRLLPIIAFTASIEKNEQQHYLDNGVNAIIGKPFSLRELRRLIEHWRAPL